MGGLQTDPSKKTTLTSITKIEKLNMVAKHHQSSHIAIFGSIFHLKTLHKRSSKWCRSTQKSKTMQIRAIVRCLQSFIKVTIDQLWVGVHPLHPTFPRSATDHTELLTLRHLEICSKTRGILWYNKKNPFTIPGWLKKYFCASQFEESLTYPWKR